MIRQKLATTTLAILLALGGYSCDVGNKGKAAIQESGEQWILCGCYASRCKGASTSSERWLGTCQLSDGSHTCLIDGQLRTPDGETVLFPRVTYNKRDNLLICEYEDFTDGEGFYNNVFICDLATGQSRWIAKWRWYSVRGFTWSPDGSKVAFVASTLGSPEVVMKYDEDDAYANKLLSSDDAKWRYYVSKDKYLMRSGVQSVVMQYDIYADQLEEAASDACRFGDCSVRQRRPAYSEDGNWLYYVSSDRNVMRVDLRTKQCEQLPFTKAIAVLTVKGEYLVYAMEDRGGNEPRFQIIRARLTSPNDSHIQKICSIQGELHGNYVSPSGRFILIEVRYGYVGNRRLVDTETATAYAVWELFGGEIFMPCNTVFTGSRGL